jgi:hypothetical protein
VPAAAVAAPVADTVRQSPAVPAARSIETSLDGETWAEYGGWYRQDYAISYRPTGHKDKLLYTWLSLTGPASSKGDKRPAAAVFDALTRTDAQGVCAKCHSVDDRKVAGQGVGRQVNFSPMSAAQKQGRFTTFAHEPHFGTMDSRGCTTCHELDKTAAYLDSYKQGDPRTFASNFGAIKKDLCQTCHTAGQARQDCVLCHTYHVNGVVTPIIGTLIPRE